MTAYACHSYHWPKPEDADDHHVVPRAWQNFWAPSGDAAKLAGARLEDVGARPTIRQMSIPDRALWHPETVRLTPSCHRAVHNRIVAIMKAFAADDRRRIDPEVATIAAAIVAVEGRGKLWEIAGRAPLEWLKAGGSLNALCDARLWGDS